jgi:hypothetical protein
MVEMIKKETEVEVIVIEVVGEEVEVEGHIEGDLMTVIGLVIQEVEAMEVLQEANQNLALSVNLKGTLPEIVLTRMIKKMYRRMILTMKKKKLVSPYSPKVWNVTKGNFSLKQLVVRC